MSLISYTTDPTQSFVEGRAASHACDDKVLPLIGVETRGQLPTQVNVPHDEPLLRITDLAAPHTGCIRILELNRPSTRNAISRALLAELRTEIDDIRSQYDPLTGDELPLKDKGKDNEARCRNGPVRALIIASALDTSFCAGADLKERKGFTTEE